jgi:hypothetical protein
METVLPVTPSNRSHRVTRWLLLLLACSFVALVARLGEVTHDAFHEMALFRQFLAAGEFPREDVFAYTPTVAPSVHHEWGTGAVLYAVTVGSGWGLAGLSLLKFSLIGLLWWLLYRVARARGAHPALFALFSIVVFPVMWVGFATVRAGLFTLVCIAAQLWMQERDRRGSRGWILAWWCMLVLWLNLHAGFVVGLGLFAMHAAERFAGRWWTTRSLPATFKATWHLFLAGPLAFLALPLNPYGWQYVTYLAHALRMPRELIVEWQPLWRTHEPMLTLMMFALSIVLVVLAVRSGPRRSLSGVLALAVCAWMALRHLRHGAIYAVVWIAYAPAWLSRTRLGREIVRGLRVHERSVVLLARGLCGACLVFSVAHAPWRTTLTGDAGQHASYPTGAVEYLQRQGFQGNLLTPFHAGAYVSWELYPRVKVSLDGRYEVAYAPQVFPEHCEFFAGRDGWETLLERYPHDAVLIHRTAPLAALLDRCRDGEERLSLPSGRCLRIVYEDDSYLLLGDGLHNAWVASVPRQDLRGQAAVDRTRHVFASERAALPGGWALSAR